MNRLIQLLTLSATLMLGLGAVAAPSQYPESFQRMGIVDDVRRDAIVINDQLYFITSSLKVNTPKKWGKNWKALRKGQTIGFSFVDDDPQRRGQVVEVWILTPELVKEYRQ